MARSTIASLTLMIIWGLGSVWMSSLSLPAHEFHISSAELEYNTDSQRYEVALKLNILDFQPLLNWINNPQVPSLAEEHDAATRPKPNDQLAEVSEREQRRLEKYCGEHFYISEASPQGVVAPSENAAQKDNVRKIDRSQLVWQGCEVELAAVWLYFELKLPEGEGPFFLTNTVLLDLNKGQTNTVVLISKGQRTALKTDHANIQVALPPIR